MTKNTASRQVHPLSLPLDKTSRISKSLKNIFTMVKTFSKMPMITRLALTFLALATLFDATQIAQSLFVAVQPKEPRQVQEPSAIFPRQQIYNV
jgi:hypothetical protein